MKRLLLLLDDEPQSTFAFEKLLRAARYDVVTASSALQAQELLERYCPHAMIVDIHLLGSMTGLEWLETLDRSPFAGIPKIILTSSSSRENVSRAVDLNVVAYVIKPSSCALITQKIEQLTDALDRSSAYSYVLGPGDSLTATLSIPGTIAGLNDSRISIEGSFQAGPLSAGVRDPRTVLYKTNLFREMGLPDPRLRFAFSESLAPRHYLNHFFLEGLDDEQRSNLRRQLIKMGYRPMTPGKLADLSLKRIGVHLLEEVHLLKLGEPWIDVIASVFLEPSSIADLKADGLDLPVQIQECTWRASRVVRARLRVDPRVTSEEGIRLRTKVLDLKRAQK